MMFFALVTTDNWFDLASKTIAMLTPLVVALTFWLNHKTSSKNQSLILDNTAKTEATGHKVSVANELIRQNATKVEHAAVRVEAAKEAADVIQREHGKHLEEIKSMVNGGIVDLLRQVEYYARMYGEQTGDANALQAAQAARDRLMRKAKIVDEVMAQLTVERPGISSASKQQ